MKKPYLQTVYIGTRNLLRKHADPNWFFSDRVEEILGGVIYAVLIFIGLSGGTLLANLL
jgi:hypothetical protein